MNNNLSVIRQAGLKALTRELGPSGTVLFIRQFENGYGNYTEDRVENLKDITLENIITSIKIRKEMNINTASRRLSAGGLARESQ